jgi:hypothetical protein
MYDKVLLRITILNVCWQLQVHHLAHQAAVASAHCPSVLGAFTLVPEQQQQQASVSSEVIKQASNKSPVALGLLLVTFLAAALHPQRAARRHYIYNDYH